MFGIGYTFEIWHWLTVAIPFLAVVAEEWLTPQEVADILKVSRWTVYSWISDGRIRYKKLGRLVRIPRSEVDRLLNQGEREMGEHGWDY